VALLKSSDKVVYYRIDSMKSVGIRLAVLGKFDTLKLNSQSRLRKERGGRGREKFYTSFFALGPGSPGGERWQKGNDSEAISVVHFFRLLGMAAPHFSSQTWT